MPGPSLICALEMNTGTLKTHQVLVAHLVSPAQLQPVWVLSLTYHFLTLPAYSPFLTFLTFSVLKSV